MNPPSTPAIKKTLTSFHHAIAGATSVLCGPLNGYGFFGWKMEAGDSPYPDAMEGDAQYGEAYLRHRTAQGFSVAFGVWHQPARVLVCLKAWEPGEDEPAWPMDTASAAVTYHGT
jgi:hypothetical protein